MIVNNRKLRNFVAKVRIKRSYRKEIRHGQALSTSIPVRETTPHVHKGDQIWIILEGSGEFLSSGKDNQVIGEGHIVIAPVSEERGIKNTNDSDLVFASITS